VDEAETERLQMRAFGGNNTSLTKKENERIMIGRERFHQHLNFRYF
jgi:hypothetical protein